MVIDWDEAPEGATHYCIGGYSGTAWRDLSGVSAKYWSEGKWHDHYGVSSEFCLKHGVFEARPTQNGWNGEGLPPVGTVCECQDESFQWHRGTIVHVGQGDGAMVAVMQTGSGILIGEKGEFRPIRTPEQIAAEERLHKIRNACTDISHTLDYLKGDIPGAAVARTVIEAMIDAGYGKQENNDAKA